MWRILWLSLVLLACREKNIQLTAAHDSPQSAFPLLADQQVQGKLPPGECRIYFRIRLAEPSMFRAQISAVRGADTRLEILNQQSVVLHTADDHGSSLAEEIYPVFLPAGEYLLRVSASAQESAEFTLFFRLFRPPADVEREPNNTPETATEVAAAHASGFYGAEFFTSGKEKVRERDCFRFMAANEGRTRAQFTLTGVDGFAAAIQILDKSGELLANAGSEKQGQLLSVGPIAVPADGYLIACILATRQQQNASRDYYELEMRLADVQLKSESEPNNTRQSAGEIAAESMDGSLSNANDKDYYYWQNRRDYPVILRAELNSTTPQLLKLEAGTEEKLRTFEGSAEKGEVADNLRVEPGESVSLLIQCSKKCNRKTFKPVTYQIRVDESQATDESETEPNDSPERADVLVDLTQKWGFINPPGDADYFRISMTQPAVRDAMVESKLSCRLRLEHLRDGKSLAISTGKGKVIYNAEFAKDDVLRLTCAGEAISPDRSYRLSLSEP